MPFTLTPPTCRRGFVFRIGRETLIIFDETLTIFGETLINFIETLTISGETLINFTVTLMIRTYPQKTGFAHCEASFSDLFLPR